MHTTHSRLSNRNSANHFYQHVLPKVRRLYVACDSGDLVVLDRATGAILASVAIAGEPDVIWLNSRRKRLYVAIGKPGILQVMDLQQLPIADEIQSDEGAKTFTFNEQRQRLFLSCPVPARR